MITVIAHFYNEEFLLPYWLRHHTRVFDHGIMINYGSTDKSVEIIKELAPNWEIRDSRNKLFHAVECDKEIMEIERTLEGWKMVLCITEFFLPKNLDFTKSDSPHNARCNPIFLVDMAGDYDKPWDQHPDQIFDGDAWGYSELDQLPFQINPNERNMVRARAVHNFPDGKYHSGRHNSDHGWGMTRDMLLLYVADYPRSSEMLKRKLQIKAKLDVEHQPNDGTGHWWEREVIEEYHTMLMKPCQPIMGIPGVAEILRKWQT